MPETAIQPQNGSYLTPTLAHATVADAMHPGIVSCDADDTLTNVARAMANHHVHCIVVTRLSHDRSGEQVVWGLISDLDLLKGSLSSPAEPNAAALARQPIISVKPSMSLRDAGELMLANHVSHIVVTDPEAGRPIGIMSTLDVAGVLAWGEA